jgi:hypothetical protein
MMPYSSTGGHSAIVKIRMHINGHTIDVAKMGPDYVVANSPVDHPPGEAMLYMQVDRNESNWKVHLPHGISAQSQRIAISAAQ